MIGGTTPDQMPSTVPMKGKGAPASNLDLVSKGPVAPHVSQGNVDPMAQRTGGHGYGGSSAFPGPAAATLRPPGGPAAAPLSADKGGGAGYGGGGKGKGGGKTAGNHPSRGGGKGRGGGGGPTGAYNRARGGGGGGGDREADQDAAAAKGAGKGGGGGHGGHRGGSAARQSKRTGVPIQYIRQGRALAGAEYGPAIYADRAQAGANNRQGRRAAKLASEYFNQLEQYVQQSVAEERGISNRLRGNLGSLGLSEQQALQGIAGQAEGELHRYSPGNKSLQAGARGSLAAQLALQQQLASQNMGAFKAGAMQQNANYKGLAASNLGSYGLAGQQEIGNIFASSRMANAPLMEQIAADRAKQNALAIADAVKLRQQAVANNLTRKSLGLKNKALNITSQYDRGRLALEKRAQDIAQAWHQAEVRLGIANLNEKTHNDAATQANRAVANNIANYRAHHSGKSGSSSSGSTPKPATPLTTHEQLEERSLYDAAKAALAHKGITVNDLVLGSVKGLPRMPYAVAEAAWEMQHYGGITAQTAALLAASGIQLGLPRQNSTHDSTGSGIGHR